MKKLPPPDPKPDPVRVDWTIDDAPDCKDCIHSKNRYQTISDLKCTKYPHTHTYLRTEQIRAPVKYEGTPGYGECGPEAKGFERKIPEVYDFRNNPPTPMQWKDDDIPTALYDVVEMTW